MANLAFIRICVQWVKKRKKCFRETKKKMGRKMEQEKQCVTAKSIGNENYNERCEVT